MRRFGSWIAEHPKRFLALLFGPALFALGVDALIGHAAGKEIAEPAIQLVPAIFGPVAAVVLVVAAPLLSNTGFAWTARIVGSASALLGLVGTVLHIVSLVRDVAAKEELSWTRFEDLVAAAPPMFAPGGFLAVGVGVFLLGLSSWHLQISPRN